MGASYQRLGIPNLELFVGSGVYYGGGVAEAQAMEGQQVYVVGAGNSAGQAVIHLAKYAERVTMIVRGDALGASMSDYLVKMIDATENVDVRLRSTVIDGTGAGRLEDSLSATAIPEKPEPYRRPPCSSSSVPSHIPYGCPKASNATNTASSSPVPTWFRPAPPLRGEPRQPLPLETTVPGVFAAGDVRHG